MTRAQLVQSVETAIKHTDTHYAYPKLEPVEKDALRHVASTATVLTRGDWKMCPVRLADLPIGTALNRFAYAFDDVTRELLADDDPVRHRIEVVA